MRVGSGQARPLSITHPTISLMRSRLMHHLGSRQDCHKSYNPAVTPSGSAPKSSLGDHSHILFSCLRRSLLFPFRFLYLYRILHHIHFKNVGGDMISCFHFCSLWVMMEFSIDFVLTHRKICFNDYLT